VPLHEIYLISAAKSFVNFGAKKKNCGARRKRTANCNWEWIC